LGNVTTGVLDRNRRTTSVTQPGVQDGTSRTTGIEYDHVGDQTRVSEANGTIQDSAYFPGGRIRSQTQNGATTDYGDDGRGALASVQQPGGNCTASTTVLCDTYKYDYAGHLTSVQQPGGNCAANDHCVSYTYDRTGAPKTVTYSNESPGANINVTSIT